MILIRGDVMTAHQLQLFTKRGKPYSLKAEKIELRNAILDALCRTFHIFNNGRPIQTGVQCPGCKREVLVFIQPLSREVLAYCSECEWHLDLTEILRR